METSTSMTKNELGGLIARVFGLIYFFKGLLMLFTNVIGLVLFWDVEQEIYIRFLYVGGMLLFVLVAALFWFKAESIGKLIAGKEGEKPIGVLNAEHILTGVFAAFGCYLLIFAIPEIADVVGVMLSPEDVRKIKFQNVNWIEKYARIGLYLGLSLTFILGCRGLQGLITKLRKSGHSETSG